MKKLSGVFNFLLGSVNLIVGGYFLIKLPSSITFNNEMIAHGVRVWSFSTPKQLYTIAYVVIFLAILNFLLGLKCFEIILTKFTKTNKQSPLNLL